MGKGQYGILFRPRDAHVKFVTKVYGLIAFGGFGQFRKCSQSLNAHVFRHLLDVIVRLFLVSVIAPHAVAERWIVGQFVVQVLDFRVDARVSDNPRVFAEASQLLHCVSLNKSQYCEQRNLQAPDFYKHPPNGDVNIHSFHNQVGDNGLHHRQTHHLPQYMSAGNKS